MKKTKKSTTQVFISKALAMHHDKYDYSKVDYVGSKNLVVIICHKHGEFLQTPSNHLRSSGCKKCQEEKTRQITAANFKKRSTQKHGDRYSYEFVKYKDSLTPVIIGCPPHGKFSQTPQQHLLGRGCPSCGRLKMEEHAQKTKKLHAFDFIKAANNRHNGKYDYSESVYASAHEKTVIKCPKHGGFLQTPSSHLIGNGCPICANENKSTPLALFILAANKKHYDKYDYSEMSYVNANSKIKIKCPIHGLFMQRASSHLVGNGCPKCAIDRMTDDTNSFVAKAKRTHGKKYDYSKTTYKHSSLKVVITCPTHGEFKQIANNHTNGGGCPKCWQNISKQQLEVAKFCESCGITTETNNRSVISPLEIDIWIESRRLGIEYHGAYHHSANSIERDNFLKYRNRDKAKAACDNKITLLQIFSNEWYDERKGKIWQSMIRHRLQKSVPTYARKLQIVELNTQSEREFFNNNHLRGYCPSSICYALTNGDMILNAMSFIKRKSYWEIQRFATHTGFAVVGGKSRLFKCFKTKQHPIRVITYADLRYSDPQCYGNLGFIYEKSTVPGYQYIKNGVVLARQKCQKHKLNVLLAEYDLNKTERENMFNNGYRRLWDAGHLKFVLDF